MPEVEFGERPVETVLKVGGSLSRGTGLPALCEQIARLGKRHRLLVVPGGGAFADQVRDAYRSFHLSETAAHRMALLAMDQYGLLLYDLMPEAVLVDELIDVCPVTAAGRVAVLRPARLLEAADPLPHSWEVTSDSLAAWIAGVVGACRLALLKEVDGLYASWPPQDGDPPLGEWRPDGRLGGIDAHLPGLLAKLGLETWVINGNHPERLWELLEQGRTLGTQIGVHIR